MGLIPLAGQLRLFGLGAVSKAALRQAAGPKGDEPSRPYYLQFTMQVGEEEFFQILQEEVEKDFDPLELVYPKEVPVFEKIR